MFVAGCATFTPAGELYRHRKIKLAVSLPEDWLRYVPARPGCTVTRDGLRLESISVLVTKVGEKLQGTDRVYRANMSPYEIAELAMGVLETAEETKNFDVKRIGAAQVLGQHGFRVEATFTDQHGLLKRLRSHGTLVRDHVCEFRYIAAESVYYERYLGDFDRLVASAVLH